MRRFPRVYASHKCPRCLKMTTAKDYCVLCLSVLRKPPIPTRASFRPDWKAKTADGSRWRLEG